MNSPLRFALVFVSAFLILFLVVGNLIGERQPSPAYKDLQLFTQSIKLIRSNYVEDVDTGLLLQGARKGLVESLDPYSSYVEPDRAKALEREQAAGDIGLTLVKGANGMVRIAAVRPGSPAQKGGLRAGRWIRAIDGRSTRDLSLLEAEQALRGPVGSRVSILLVGAGEEGEDAATENPGADAETPDAAAGGAPDAAAGGAPDAGAGGARDAGTGGARDAGTGGARDAGVGGAPGGAVGEEFLRADLSSLRLEIGRPREGVGMIRPFDLEKGAAGQVRAALEILKGEGRGSLLLDLRENPGGDPDETVAVASLFLPPGTPVLQLRRGEEKAQVRKTSGTPVWQGPLSVLQDPSTLAEAEALGAALRDGCGSRLVGARTFGKGLRQESFRLPDGAVLRLSTQVLLTGKGDDFRKTGIEPDVEVERSAQLASGRTPPLRPAEGLPLGVTPEQVNPPPEPGPKEQQEEWDRLLIEKGIEALAGASAGTPPAPER